MKPGEKFELMCYEYLKKTYKNEKIDFYHGESMDSTKPDIAVIKNGKIIFFIEVKDKKAQSGQFVVKADKLTKKFDFSAKNKSNPNEMTDVIIDYMNSNFEYFSNAGTAGQHLDINMDIFENWIIKYYENKNVKYVISFDGEYVIFPIRKFGKYFDITASYRVKKSGSRKPAKKDIDIIKQYIKCQYSNTNFIQDKDKIYVEIDTPLITDRFRLDGFTYYLSKQSSNKYEVRKLSNTYNMNVIFSIKLIKSQSLIDLKEFELEF